MRKLLVSTVVTLAWVVPALAQDAPGDASRDVPRDVQSQAAAASAAHGQQDAVNQGVPSFEQRVEQRLTQAGFSNIEMVPTSILIRAIDRDGNPVTLALSPDSLAELLAVPGGENDGSGNDGSGSDAPSRQPAPTAPNAGETK